MMPLHWWYAASASVVLYQQKSGIWEKKILKVPTFMLIVPLTMVCVWGGEAHIEYLDILVLPLWFEMFPGLYWLISESCLLKRCVF